MTSSVKHQFLIGFQLSLAWSAPQTEFFRDQIILSLSPRRFWTVKICPSLYGATNTHQIRHVLAARPPCDSSARVHTRLRSTTDSTKMDFIHTADASLHPYQAMEAQASDRHRHRIVFKEHVADSTPFWLIALVRSFSSPIPRADRH